MDIMTLRILQKEVERQCKFGIMSFQDLQEALQKMDVDRIWYYVQAFLVAAGNISKLLWPPKPILPNRGNKLRESLFVSNDSPLEPRRFRNHFEHFDERIERWATFSPRKNFVDSNIGPSGMITGPDLNDFLRNFNTTNFSIRFRGDEYSLHPVANAIIELWEKAKVEASKPHWD